MRALYPGSFDPLTNGHMDLIERASALFGDLVVAVLCNPSKRPAFSVEERIAQIRVSTSHLKGVSVISFDGLSVNCANTHQADLILRGLRAMSDFEYELQIAHTDMLMMRKRMGGHKIYASGRNARELLEFMNKL